MATSTLIQFLDAGEGDDTSNRRQVETFFAGGTIAAGDVVALDTGKTGADRVLYVIQAGLVATGNAAAVGVALNNAAANEQVRVVVSGYASGVNCTAGTIGAAGIALSAGKTAAGQVDAAANTDTAGLFAVSLGAKAGNVVDIHILKRF